MKAKELIKVLQENPEADVIFWNGEDNYDIDGAELDAVNGIEFVLSNSWLIQQQDV